MAHFRIELPNILATQVTLEMELWFASEIGYVILRFVILNMHPSRILLTWVQITNEVGLAAEIPDQEHRGGRAPILPDHF